MGSSPAAGTLVALLRHMRLHGAFCWTSLCLDICPATWIPWKRLHASCPGAGAVTTWPACDGRGHANSNTPGQSTRRQRART